MDTIEERIAAARETDDSYDKLTHLNSALDLIILKVAIDEGIVDDESGYSITEALSNEKFPAENRKIFEELGKRISSGMHGKEAASTLKNGSGDSRSEILQNADEIHKSVDELISEIEALNASIQK